MKKNKLYTANRWNQPAFMVDRESHNIFDGFTLGQSNQMYRNPFGIQLLNSSNSPVSNDIMQKAPNINWSNPVQRNMALGQTKAIAGSSGSNNPIDIQKSNQMLSKSIGGSSKKGGIFGNNTGWGGLGALAGGVTGALSGIQTGDPRGMWDTLDPVFHLAEGRETKAGNVMSDAGVALTQAGLSSGQPYLALAGAGMKILGGLTNAAFGIKVDEDKLNKANENLSELRNFRSNADSFDAIKGPVATESVSGTYEGGWFSHDRGQRKQRALENSMQEARQLAFRAVNNNIHNLSNDQMNDALANYSAFGGPIETGDMGAIDYGFMSDYLTQRKRENDMKSKMNGIVPMPAFMPNSYAIGGDLQINRADYSVGKIYDVSEKEANRLKAIGYEFTVVG